MERLSSFVSELKNIYGQQEQVGKVALVGGLVLLLCCLCFIPLRLVASRNSSNVVPSPFVVPSEVSMPTPTALFNFGLATFTPFPTFPTSTGLPTITQVPTGTPSLTPIAPTPTMTSIPTATSTPPSAGSLSIVTVNKPEEYVDIKNVGGSAVDLAGWRLVSETGNQSCTLRGVLQPNEVLRIWAGTGGSGLSCDYPINIWNDNELDPAVLYNSQGQEVSRFINP